MKQGKNKQRVSGIIMPVIFTLFVFLSSHTDAQTASGAGLRLVGTINGAQLIGAVFQDSSGSQTFFHLQDALPDGSRIVKVRNDSIMLKGEDGTVYDMYIARDTKTASQPQPVTVSPALSPDKTMPVEKRSPSRNRRRLLQEDTDE